MKIQVVERKFKAHDSIQKSYKIANCEYCCEGIKELPDIDFYFKQTENTDNPIVDDYEWDQDLGIMLHNEVTYHDGWGYDVDANFVKYLHKLRKCRNNIVHSERTEEAMTIDEIKFCIDYICRMG